MAKRKTAKAKAPAKKAAKKRASTRFAKNQGELAAALNISRSTIARMMRLPGRPETTDDNRYDIGKWKKFHEVHKKDVENDEAEQKFREDKRQLELSKLRLQVDQEQLDYDEKKGRLVDIESVLKTLDECFGGVIQAQKEAAVAIAPQVAGAEYAEALEIIRGADREALSRFALGEWAKKKPFWRDVYAKLLDLQATYNPGSGLSVT